MRLCYLHLPRFPIQRRVLEQPSLRGKPFALVQDDRGVRRLAFSAGAAQALGARPGMTLTAACARIPNLTHLTYQPEAERAALTSLGEALLSLGPSFELCAPDGLWLDASAAHLFGGEEGLCQRALERCLEHGYQARAVVASQKFTSRALARHGEDRTQVVEYPESLRALAPLPLSALEEDLATRADFGSLGLSTLGEIAALPIGAVVARLGAAGVRTHRLCRGEDDAAYVPATLPEVIEELLTLEWPADALEPLLFSLKTAVDRIAARLAGRRRAAVRLTFQLRLDPSGRHDVTLTLARPTSQAKLLLDLARHRILELQVENPIGGVLVRVEEACEDRGQQLALGDAPEGDAALEVVLSRLATTLGEETLFAAEVVPTHRPEKGYAARAFRPPPPQKGMLAELSRQAAPAPRAQVDPVSLERPSRVFVQPAALDAELDGKGELLSARLLGKRRKVTAVAGPERLCGEWWEELAFSRDYYRVYFEGIGPVWVFRDGRDGGFYLQGLFD